MRRLLGVVLATLLILMPMSVQSAWVTKPTLQERVDIEQGAMPTAYIAWVDETIKFVFVSYNQELTIEYVFVYQWWCKEWNLIAISEADEKALTNIKAYITRWYKLHSI